MIACDGGGNWRSDNGWTLLNHVTRQMNARKLSTGPITSSYQWMADPPTHRTTPVPRVHRLGQPTWQVRWKRWKLSDRLLRDVSTRVYVILRCLAWHSQRHHVDPLPHRNYFYDPSKRSLRLQASGRAAAWDCCSLTGLTWIRFSAAWVGRAANLICVSLREIKLLVTHIVSSFFIDPRLRFVLLRDVLFVHFKKFLSYKWNFYAWYFL